MFLESVVLENTVNTFWTPNISSVTGMYPFSVSPFVIVLITAVAPELSPVIVSPAVNPLGAISRLLIFSYIILEPAEV